MKKQRMSFGDKCRACREVWPLDRREFCSICCKKFAHVDIDDPILMTTVARTTIAFDTYAQDVCALQNRQAADAHALKLYSKNTRTFRIKQAILYSLCTAMQMWSVDSLGMLLEGGYLLASRAFPLMIFFANEFAYDCVAVATFQCLIASRVLDSYHLWEIVRNNDDGGKIAGVAVCYHMGGGNSEIQSVIPSGFRHKQPLSCFAGRDTKEMLIPASSRLYFEQATTLLLLLCKEKWIPPEMARHIWLYLSLSDWTIANKSAEAVQYYSRE